LEESLEIARELRLHPILHPPLRSPSFRTDKQTRCSPIVKRSTQGKRWQLPSKPCDMITQSSWSEPPTLASQAARAPCRSRGLRAARSSPYRLRESSRRRAP